MGYSLECFALDHAELQGLLGSGREDVLQKVLAQQEKLFTTSPGLSWHAALQELLLGERGRALARLLAAGRSEPASAEEAIALVALVRLRGRPLGELIHNSRAGAKFRQLFAPPFADPRLLSRPLCGLVRQDYPGWGGLTRAELGGLEPLAWPAPGDPDQAQWLFELADLLSDARDCGRDLLTLYL
jgi:hypothetical protein